MAPPSKETVINLRAPAYQRSLIDQAATLSGKSRTEFMLDAATEKAQQVLLDRTVFALDETRFEKFLAILDEPTSSTALKAINKLMARKAPWESPGK